MNNAVNKTSKLAFIEQYTPTTAIFIYWINDVQNYNENLKILLSEIKDFKNTCHIQQNRLQVRP